MVEQLAEDIRAHERITWELHKVIMDFLKCDPTAPEAAKYIALFDEYSVVHKKEIKKMCWYYKATAEWEFFLIVEQELKSILGRIQRALNEPENKEHETGLLLLINQVRTSIETMETEFEVHHVPALLLTESQTGSEFLQDKKKIKDTWI